MSPPHWPRYVRPRTKHSRVPWIRVSAQENASVWIKLMHSPFLEPCQAQFEKHIFKPWLSFIRQLSAHPHHSPDHYRRYSCRFRSSRAHHDSFIPVCRGLGRGALSHRLQATTPLETRDRPSQTSGWVCGAFRCTRKPSCLHSSCSGFVLQLLHTRHHKAKTHSSRTGVRRDCFSPMSPS